jgi:hypothetical protein
VVSSPSVDDKQTCATQRERCTDGLSTMPDNEDLTVFRRTGAPTANTAAPLGASRTWRAARFSWPSRHSRLDGEVSQTALVRLLDEGG